MINTEYIRSLNANYERMTLGEKPEEKRYQYCMISRGGIKGLLPCSLRYIDGNAYLYYDITSRQNIAQLFDKKVINRQWLTDFLWSMRRVRQEMSRFLLEESNIVWFPNHIYQDLEKNDFYFIYIPYCRQETGFHELLEYLIEHIDYQDEEMVEYLYKAYEQYETAGEVYLQQKIYEDAECLRISGIDPTEHTKEEMIQQKTEDILPAEEKIENTKEIEFDAVAQNGEVVEYAISEHVEFAGVHSGDATLVFPAQKIYFATARRIKKISRQIAKELNISGPFNIQFLARNNEVKVIECNLRASRSFPFVSKVLKRNFIETATRIMLDAPYSRPDKSAFDIDWIGVKASQFSFSRLHKADPVLGVDMSSTGEVGCIGDDFSEALLNSMIATGFKIPEKAVMFSSGAMKSKVDLLDASRMLFAKGYQIYATAGTAAFLNAHGVDTTPVYWPDEKPGAENNVMKMIADHKFDLIVNIPKNHSKRELTNGYRIRRGAIDHNIPLITNARLASAFIEVVKALVIMY